MRKLLTLSAILVFSLAMSAPAADLYFARHGRDYYFLGEGRADPKITNQTQSRALAKDAAILDAYKKIALYVDGGFRTREGTTVDEAKVKDEVFKKKIDAYIQGAQVLKANWDREGACRVTVKIDRKDLMKALDLKVR